MSNNSELKPSAPKTSAHLVTASKDSKAKPSTIKRKRDIEVIEVIRLSKRKPATQTTATRTPKRAVTFSGQAYTIQIGAYKKENSRQTVISQFTADAPLYLFPMKNSLLGLSYGSFDTINQAKAQASLLIKKGYTDLHIRKAPQSAQKP